MSSEMHKIVGEQKKLRICVHTVMLYLLLSLSSATDATDTIDDDVDETTFCDGLD